MAHAAPQSCPATTRRPLARHPLRAARLAEQATAELLHALRRPLRGCGDLGDQARRAAISVTLNVVEGHAQRGGNRLRHWRAAHGSCQEVKAALRLLAAAGALSGGEAERLHGRFDEVGRLLWGLLRRPGR